MRQKPLILAQYFTHMSEFTSQTRHDHEILLRDRMFVDFGDKYMNTEATAEDVANTERMRTVTDSDVHRDVWRRQLAE